MAHSPSRRGVLAGLAGIAGGSALARPGLAQTITPSATEGPFYPTPAMRMPDVDNDLVRVMGLVEEAGGDVFMLRGTISDTDGLPLAGLRIEIWQTDMNGRYLHTGDRGNGTPDEAFQGFGHDITDEAGGYVFRTIAPVPYPGRTPHIHVKVLNGETEVLTSQFYLKDNPANARDRIFGRMSEAEAESVSMDIQDGPDGREATVDLVI